MESGAHQADKSVARNIERTQRGVASRHKGLATQQNERAVQIRSELEVAAVCVFQENTTAADGFVKAIIRSPAALFSGELPWSFYIIRAKRLIFKPEQLLWMLCFCLYQGTTFSRAVKNRRGLGFSPWLRLRGKEKSAWAKALKVFTIYGPTKVVP